MAHLQWSGVNVGDGPGQLQHIQEWSGAGLCGANNGPGHDCVVIVIVQDIHCTSAMVQNKILLWQ
jgi:hypothetical protein